MIPPLLNDFIGLQKDTALVGFLGSVEAFKQSQIDAAATFNYTPFVAAAVLFVALTIPLARFTDWLVAPRPAPAGRGRQLMSEALRRRQRAQVLRGAGGPARSGSCRRGPRGRLPHRRLRLREVDPPALRQPARADRPGRIVVEGEEITARGVNVNKVRRRIGIVFQAYNLFPHMSVLANVTLAPRLALRTPRAQGEAEATACSTASGSPTSATTIRTDSRAASSSGSQSCGRWR